MRLNPLRNLLSFFQTLGASETPRDTPTLFWLGAAYMLRHQVRPRAVHPRFLGGAAVRLRPGTRDLVTYHDVFVRRYHVPQHCCNALTILDMGANIGLVSRWFAEAFPHAEIVSVEMDRDNFALLLENTKAIGHRARQIHAAVWVHSEGVSYRADSAEDAFAACTPSDTSAQNRAVPSVTPARLVDMFDRRQVDLVKMDVEGAERQLLLEADVSWLSCVRCLLVEGHDPDVTHAIQQKLIDAGFHVERSALHWAGLEAWRP